jgi:hypothetical protein
VQGVIAPFSAKLGSCASFENGQQGRDYSCGLHGMLKDMGTARCVRSSHLLTLGLASSHMVSVCSWLSRNFLACASQCKDKWKTCPQHAAMAQACLQHASSLHLACILHVSSMHPACNPYATRMHSAFVQYVSKHASTCIYTLYIQHAHSMHSVKHQLA